MSALFDSTKVSVPDSSMNVSRPVPPVTTSSPVPLSRRSAKAEPMTRSSPLPATICSASKSLPVMPLAFTVSLPPLLSITSVSPSLRTLL